MEEDEEKGWMRKCVKRKQGKKGERGIERREKRMRSEEEGRRRNGGGRNAAKSIGDVGVCKRSMSCRWRVCRFSKKYAKSIRGVFACILCIWPTLWVATKNGGDGYGLIASEL